MKCFVCFLHITKRSNHLGCMGCIIFTNISDCTSPVRSDIIHNTTDNFTLLIGYFTLGLPQPQVEILFGCGDYTVQSLDLAESKAYQLYDIGQSIALFLVVECFTLFGERMAYEFQICLGLKWLFAILSLFSKSFNIE